jgi:hypothetical protein
LTKIKTEEEDSPAFYWDVPAGKEEDLDSDYALLSSDASKEYHRAG